MSRLNIWIVSNGAFASALYLAIFEETTWLRYIVITFIWFMLLAYTSALLSNDLVEKMQGKLSPAPIWVVHSLDFIFFFLMLLANWYITSAAYALSCAIHAEVHRRLREKPN
jgi:hypothetical protein